MFCYKWLDQISLQSFLAEKWVSILFHVQNKHSSWLNPTSEAFVAMQNIVLDKTLLSDLKNITNFSHTGSLKFTILHIIRGYLKAHIFLTWE